MSADIEHLLARVARLEARAEIGELVSTYAVACDEHDMPVLTSLFTEDAGFESPSGLLEAEGRAAIAAMFVELFRVRGPAFHWTHDHFVTFGADPDRATGRVFSHAETSPAGEMSLAAMRYDDEYRREAGTWRFARRRISFLYYVPARDFATALVMPNRLAVSGLSLPADYPEALATWRDFDRTHVKGETP